MRSGSCVWNTTSLLVLKSEDIDAPQQTHHHRRQKLPTNQVLGQNLSLQHQGQGEEHRGDTVDKSNSDHDLDHGLAGGRWGSLWPTQDMGKSGVYHRHFGTYPLSVVQVSLTPAFGMLQSELEGVNSS